MFVIGGWLGSGTYASYDLFVLNLDTKEWKQLQTSGQNPGPCNMHSADVLEHLIYIFRGGDGKDYLNDLHCIDTETKEWRLVQAKGKVPEPRANHCSSLVNRKIYIFGGWDG